MINTYIDIRMNVWAEWCLRRGDSGLGFPGQSSYTNLMPRTGFSANTPEMNQEAFEIERCVCAVRLVNEQLFVVIVQAYLKTNTTPEQRYKACGCCKQTFYNRLERAQQMVLGYLNDIAADYPLPTVSNYFKQVA